MGTGIVYLMLGHKWVRLLWNFFARKVMIRCKHRLFMTGKR